MDNRVEAMRLAISALPYTGFAGTEELIRVARKIEAFLEGTAGHKPFPSVMEAAGLGNQANAKPQ